MTCKVDKEVHVRSENGKPISVVAITRRSANPSEWIEVISQGPLGAERLWRISNDSGRTWESFEPAGMPPARKPIEGTRVISHWQSGLFRDEEHNVLISGWLKATMDESMMGHLDSGGLSTRKMYYQISRDGGKNWGELCPIIEGEYDRNNWPDGVGCYGGNVDINQGITLTDNSILFVTFKFRHFPETGSIESPEGGWWLAAGTVKCKWIDSGLNCEFGQWLTIDRDKSSRGLCEPTVVELSDGRVLMIMRGEKPVKTDFPGVKFYSVSHDSGMTWSEPKILTYEDGSPMYSSSAMVQVFRWNACDGIYLITNILERDDIIRECDPRYPIQIAKLNEETLCVEKDSITVIEDRQSEQAANIRFSNFVHMEDRQTGALRIYMTACPGNVGKKSGDNVPLDSYEYTINEKRRESDGK